MIDVETEGVLLFSASLVRPGSFVFENETKWVVRNDCIFQFTVTRAFGDVYNAFDIPSLSPSNHATNFLSNLTSELS